MDRTIGTKQLRLTIYTDGAASGNPGPGGYGVVLESSAGHQKELSVGFRLTTNNRMELLAVIQGLRELKSDKIEVVVVSDSKYVVDAVNKGWLFSWVKKASRTKKIQIDGVKYCHCSKNTILRFNG